MQRLWSAILVLMGTALVVSGCQAVSNLPGATLIYVREMTDLEGQETLFRAYNIANAPLYEAENVEASVNYAAAKFNFESPTYLIVFKSLSGISISHTSDLSLALPLLARELCGDRPVLRTERELDWGSGNRNIYVECQTLPIGQDVASSDSTAVVTSMEGEGVSKSVALPDPDYVLNYQVIYDMNGDEPNARVSISPNGTRSVEAPRTY